MVNGNILGQMHCCFRRERYNLVLGASRKIMTVDEMRQLVKICYTAETKSAAMRQMHRVLSRERPDILSDAGISGPTVPLLSDLF